MRRRLLAALATASFVMLGTGSAIAGGPTSVLLVVPGEGRTASLYAGNPDYATLIDLVGGYDVPNGSTTPPKGADDQGASGTNDSSGAGVTLTWLMHDVTVWRVDRVYLNADGGPLVSTQMNLEGGDLWAKPPIWHRADRGKELALLLDHLGVGPVSPVSPAGSGSSAPAGSGSSAPAGSGSSAPVGSGSSAAPVSGTPAADSSGAHPITTAADGDRWFDDGWIWGPAGLVLGVALTLAATGLRRPSIEPPTTGTTVTDPSTDPGTDPGTDSHPDSGASSGAEEIKV